MSRHLGMWSALCVAVATSSSGVAQIIVNGGFESPGVSGALNLSGPFSLPGWSGVMPSSGGNGGVVAGSNNGLAPAEGNQHFTFNGGNPSSGGYIEQSFATTPGVQYSLSFAVGRAGGSQSLQLGAEVQSSTGLLLSSQSVTPPSAVGYQSIVMSFIATSDSSRVRFTDQSGGNSVSDLYLDNVSVSLAAVPEPASWAVIAGLAVGLVAWRRRVAAK